MEIDRIGQVVDKWKLDELIGRGAMGEVYHAHRNDGVVEGEAAVKVMHASAGESLPDEAARLRSLRHKNIVRYFGSGLTDDGRRYLAMEYVDGPSITDYADQMGLSIWQRLTLFQQVCDAVSWAHLHFILHLDLKPANILVGKDNTVRVVDFGIARLLDDEAETAKLTAHSGVYASPEQIQGGRLGCAADIYGLGATLYELLCGHEPFNPCLMDGELERQIGEEMPPPPSEAINVAKLHRLEEAKYSRVEPERLARMRGGRGLTETRKLLQGDLDRVCLYALRKEPERRFRTVDEFKTDIGRALKREPPEFAHSDGLGYLAWRTAYQRPLAVAAVVFAIAATYSSHLVSDSQSESRRTSLETKRQVDQVVEFSLKELNEQLRPRLASDPSLAESLAVLDAERGALTAKSVHTPAGEIMRQGDSLWERIRRMIPGHAVSRMP
jgi:serine/threonine-protein kinase